MSWYKNYLFEKINYVIVWKSFFLLFTAYQGGKKVLGCGSNVVDHIYNVKGKLKVLKAW